jgi:hypothetical protein
METTTVPPACLFLPELPDDVSEEEIERSFDTLTRASIAYIGVKYKDEKITKTHCYINFYTIMDGTS